MASFVLVHGSGQNASCWAEVGAVLTARGHDVAAPDLPKHEPGWRLEDHAALIAESAGDPETVLVGHSFSGVFLPLAARIRRCGLMVFLAAVIPEPGRSVRDQFTADPTMFSPAWIEAGPRWFDATQTERLAREFLFHDGDEHAVARALPTVELLETRSLITQPAPFATWPGVPAASIAATLDRTLSPEWIRRTSRRVLGVEAVGIEAGHCPQSTRPREVAALLERLAGGRGSSPRPPHPEAGA